MLLDWAAAALSFFNTIAALWLGLTVLLNADRRAWGTWVAGGGLVLGGLFFAVHSAAIARPDGFSGAAAMAWWPVGWIPLTSPPYLWYVVTAWYSGVLRTRWHRVWFAVLTTVALAFLGWLTVANPVITYGGAAPTDPTPRGEALPLLVLGYLVYSSLCFSLSLTALRRPQASGRPMGEVARRRARPWLVGAGLVLFVESLVIAATAAGVLETIQSPRGGLFVPLSPSALEVADLIVSGLLAAAVVLVGRAVVSYEIFTGKSLPRGGLFRQWRNSLILAAGFGTLVGGALVLPVDPLYAVGLATVLIASFSALVTYRVHAERQRDMDRLRPFVASQRLYEHLLDSTPKTEVDAVAPFHALCADVLGARLAYLIALGPLAALAGPPLRYPSLGVLGAPDAAGLADLALEFRSPQVISVPLDPAAYSGAVWAVPLWSERGLIGALLLGAKADGGLYTEEEIEIARATGERLVDARATAEMAGRLVALQRQQLAESQVLDHRMRQSIHDDVLPRLHTSMLLLGGMGPSSNGSLPAAVPASDVGEAVDLIGGAHRQLAELLRSLPATAAPEVARLGLVRALRQALDGDLGNHFDGVEWAANAEAERVAQELSSFSAEVLYCAAREAIRNAARHGRGEDSTRPLHLFVAMSAESGIQVSIEDDGAGFRESAAPSDGTGHGLALHSTLMAVIGGGLTVESATGRRTRVVLALPLDTNPEARSSSAAG